MRLAPVVDGFVLDEIPLRGAISARRARRAIFIVRSENGAHGGGLERKKVGHVFHYFSKVGVAAINLTDGDLKVGDTVQIQGPTTNFTQPVESMQIEQQPVVKAAKGQSVGIRVKERVREKDLVYAVTP